MSESWESEERDDRGRWSGGGGGGSVGASEGAADGSLTVGEPGPAGNLTAEQYGEVQQAVDDAVARNPGLLEGPHPLTAVTFTSAHITDPSRVYQEGERVPASAIEQDPLSQDVATANVQAVAQIDPRQPYEVQFNDLRFNPTSASADSSQTPYGAMTHELGHVEFAQNGVLSDREAGPLLEARGLTPDVIASEVGSKYGASSPLEGMAEMYGMQHTPGYSLPDSVATPFSKLEASLSSLRPQYEARIASEPQVFRGFYGRSRLLKGDSPGLSAVLAEAERNIRARSWTGTSALARRLFEGRPHGTHPSAGKLPR